MFGFHTEQLSNNLSLTIRRVVKLCPKKIPFTLNSQKHNSIRSGYLVLLGTILDRISVQLIKAVVPFELNVYLLLGLTVVSAADTGDLKKTFFL